MSAQRPRACARHVDEHRIHLANGRMARVHHDGGDIARFDTPKILDQPLRAMQIPIARDDRTLTIATSDPNNVGASDEVAFRTGYKVKVVLAPQRGRYVSDL